MRPGGGADADSVREACRAQASPKVKVCVERTMTAAHGRANVPAAIPAEKKEPLPDLDAPPTRFVPPPRSISDIAAILDSEKPDASRINELKSAADAVPPANISKAALAWFYYTRGNARSQLGRLSLALEDADRALEVGRGVVDANVRGRLQQFAGLQYLFAGSPQQALVLFSTQLRDSNLQGWHFNASQFASNALLQMGDIERAEAHLRKNLALIQQARTSGHPRWRSTYALIGQSWEADVEMQRAMVFEARGQYREAQNAYHLAERRRRASMKGILSLKNAPPESQLLQAVDSMILAQARIKAKQGRLAEAEADARRALLSRLKDQGKYHPFTTKFVMGLAYIVAEQGRFLEAERLARVSLEINRNVGVAVDSQSNANILSFLGGILNLQGKANDAAAVYAELDQAIARWEPQRRQVFDLNSSRIYSLYSSGQIEAGLTAAQALLKREASRVGEKHFETAAARGTVAVGYMRAGKEADAIREFKTAIPVLMAAAHENGDDDTALIAARTAKLQNVVEAYIDLLARSQRMTADEIAAETFRLADTVRGQSVQQALTAASVRMIATDPSLSDLIRTEQDLSKQVGAQLGMLNNVLSLPSGERDDDAVRLINATIEKARTDREKVRADIGRRFPSYADLIDPKAPNIEEVKETLRQGEVLLSFYFGRRRSFLWAIPKHGPVTFAPISATAADIESKVRQLRAGLEAEAATLSDIPAYDLALAHELYELLMEPAAASWKPATSLIIVTNGALGLLPLSLLPTARVEVKAGDEPLFSLYRKVPWLARTHAVAMVPSASALRTLRQLPTGPADRDPMTGFGDPFFSTHQMLEAQALTNSQKGDAVPEKRGAPFRRRAALRTNGVDSADLAQLPRLPDTADELEAIARALRTDPLKVLALRKDANERKIKDTDLTRFRIIAFATHGLIPGDLDGLSQPALALTAPDVAEIDGDGLLTMEEVLALKLDADWVVLSACNTGLGTEAGAEAVSGLGRAFFYAGTRALLVTNWAVHSEPARQLVTDTFRRQAADPGLSRAEALRQATVALIDGPGFVDQSGKPLFSYAHPVFWAPYSIIGDGGSR
jgi:CHAT domain-containing protein